MTDERTAHTSYTLHFKDRGMPEIRQGDHTIAAMAWNLNNTDDDFENARRIVACVNALAGIPTEAIEAGAIRALIDALIDVLDWLPDGSVGWQLDNEVYGRAIAALDKLGERSETILDVAARNLRGKGIFPRSETEA